MLINATTLNGAPKAVMSLCEKFDFLPQRIITTYEGTILFSWFSSGKYAEMEFGSPIMAWFSFEEGSPQEFQVAEDLDAFTKILLLLQDLME